MLVPTVIESTARRLLRKAFLRMKVPTVIFGSRTGYWLRTERQCCLRYSFIHGDFLGSDWVGLGVRGRAGGEVEPVKPPQGKRLKS